jgi:hypothetical protein
MHTFSDADLPHIIIWYMQISTIDLYANELKEKTIMGGFITALVWAATLVYLAILIFQVSEHLMIGGLFASPCSSLECRYLRGLL